MSTLKHVDIKITAEHFEYLDELRASGETNMLAAAPYLQREFGLVRREAWRVLSAWMETFTSERTPEMRVRGYYAEVSDG